jgi:hypothetical protein
LSRIEGNLAADAAVLADIQRSSVEALYILGDVIAPTADSEQVITRLSFELCAMEPPKAFRWSSQPSDLVKPSQA